MPTRISPHPFVARAARALLPAALSGLAACGGPAPALQVPGGDADRGRLAIQRYGCAACHVIPGIDAQTAHVGPPLTALGKRAYLAGLLPNTPDQLIRWLRDPPAVDPRTAMPNLGISAADAADVAAYLYAAR